MAAGVLTTRAGVGTVDTPVVADIEVRAPDRTAPRAAYAARTHRIFDDPPPPTLVLKVKWDVGRGEVSYQAMNFKPIDTEGATYASSATLAAYLGVAATLPV